MGRTMIAAISWRRLAIGISSAMFWTLAATAAMADPPECLPTSTIDCSTKWGNLFRPIAVAAIAFDDACLHHDLCYRHGEATYGYTKDYCDDVFRAELDTLCAQDIAIVDVVTLGLTRVFCNIGKYAFYAAVSRTRIAGNAFQTGINSSCCRYDYPAPPLPQCVV